MRSPRSAPPRVTYKGASVRFNHSLEPDVSLAYVTRKATVLGESDHGTALPLHTSVQVEVTTDTYYKWDGAMVAVTIEVSRNRQSDEPKLVQFDIVASELDVLVAALTKAVEIAHESDVIAEPLAKCRAIAEQEADWWAAAPKLKGDR